MVKYLFSFILLFSMQSQAAFLLGVSTNTWQEKIPVIVSAVPSQVMTSFTSFGLNAGFDALFTNRIRYALVASYITGKADLHKLDNAVSPRRNFSSVWLTNKLHWRVTKSFSFGPSMVLNYRRLDGLDAALSSGGFLDFDYDLSEDARLTQSLGTMSDSGQLAYAFTLNFKF